MFVHINMKIVHTHTHKLIYERRVRVKLMRAAGCEKTIREGKLLLNSGMVW